MDVARCSPRFIATLCTDVQIKLWASVKKGNPTSAPRLWPCGTDVDHLVLFLSRLLAFLSSLSLNYVFSIHRFETSVSNRTVVFDWRWERERERETAARPIFLFFQQNTNEPVRKKRAK